MDMHGWWLFVGAVFLLSGTPGPNMLHVMSRSIELGFRSAVAAMAGCLLAIAIVLTASAAGLAAVLLAVPGLFDILRYAGAGYLVWLGIRAWRTQAPPIDIGAGRLLSSPSAWRVFRGGFLISISNPKLLLFATAFLSQFIDRTQPKAPQFAILVVTFLVIETLWYLVYALGGRSLAGFLEQPSMRTAFNRLSGTIFLGFGVALLRAKAAG